MSNLSYTSSLSVQTFPESESDMAVTNSVIRPSAAGVNASINPTLNGTSMHAAHISCLEDLTVVQNFKSSIEFAYYVYGLNDYLADITKRKENKFKRKVLNETCFSDANSIASLKFPAFRDQLPSSFYGSLASVSGFHSNHHHSIKNYNMRDLNSSRFPINKERVEVPSSFCGSLASVSGLHSNHHYSIKNNNMRDLNSSGFPVNKERVEVHSSLFGTSNRNVSSFQANNSRKTNYSHQQNLSAVPQKFTEMEDTFPSGIQNTQSFNKFTLPKNSHFERGKCDALFDPNTVQSSFFDKSSTKLNEKVVNNSLLRRNNNSIHNDSGFPNRNKDNTENNFNCVRVGPLSSKFHLPAVHEVEVESENESVSTVKSSGEEHVAPQSNSNSSKNSDDHSFILKDWTISLKNSRLCLNGTLIRQGNVYKNFVSDEVDKRTRDGKIKTQNGGIFTLEGPVVLHENIPPKIKNYFRNNIFPVHWRTMLKNWIAAEEIQERKPEKTKLKQCQVVLERRDLIVKNPSLNSKMNETRDTSSDLKENKKKKKDADEMKEIIDKSSKVNKKILRDKRTPIKKNQEKKKKLEESLQTKDIGNGSTSRKGGDGMKEIIDKSSKVNQKILRDQRILVKENQNPSLNSKMNETRDTSSHLNGLQEKKKKLEESFQTKDVGNGSTSRKGGDGLKEVIDKSSKVNQKILQNQRIPVEENQKANSSKKRKLDDIPTKDQKKKKKINIPTDTKNIPQSTTNKAKTNTTDKKQPIPDQKKKTGKKPEQNRNIQDLYGLSISNPSDKNPCTPSSLLRSINKNPPLLNGRHTPPMKMMSEFLNKNKVKRAIAADVDLGSKDNPVAKRMEQIKGVKKVMKKRNNEKNYPINDEIQNIMSALTNKTPQTTPKVIREVFRKEGEEESSDSDFGSDVSPISS